MLLGFSPLAFKIAEGVAKRLPADELLETNLLNRKYFVSGSSTCCAAHLVLNSIVYPRPSSRSLFILVSQLL